jgi:hypothetical protein
VSDTDGWGRVVIWWRRLMEALASRPSQHPEFKFEFWAGEENPRDLALEREEYDSAFADYMAEKAKIGVYR